MTALLHERFEEQVGRTPDAIAVRFGDQTMTYAVLNARSNRLARQLRSAGVETASLTAIALPRSDLLVVAVLAVLKAGGTYLYLDANDPAERQRSMLASAGAIAVITGSEPGRSAVPAEPQPGEANGATGATGPAWAEVVTVNADDRYREHSDANLHTSICADQAAYALFTSGSTGQPKGVMVSHRAVTSYLEWAVADYRIADGTGAPVHTSLGFDLTITSLFGPLMCGRTAVMIPEEEAMRHLVDELESGRDFSILKATPSHLLVLEEYLDPSHLAGSVRTLIVGGEPLRGEVLRTWRAHAPATRIVNEYGPTEATVGCCRHWVTPDDSSGPVPIGTAAPTTQLYILDEEQEPVPDGELGELYITGSQLAIGYLNNRQATRQRFTELELSPEARRRAYRTGDLVRRDERGCLMYAGRNDRQVKIRGYRVELGEIESALYQDPQVAEAHVIFTDGIISAYIRTGTENGKIDTRHLARLLQKTLPPYMAPSRYIEVTEVPLTVNGKVDYKRLAVLGDMPDERILTGEEMHKAMLDIWSTVLEKEVTDLDQNFFTLGGDSILAVQMVARARDRGLPVSLQQVFARPTIRQLVDDVVRHGSAAGHADEAVAGAGSELEQILRSVM